MRKIQYIIERIISETPRQSVVSRTNPASVLNLFQYQRDLCLYSFYLVKIHFLRQSNNLNQNSNKLYIFIGMIIRFRFFHKKYAAMTIWPFIFVKEEVYKLDKLMMNHERIHLFQQIELLILPFFIWYVVEFLIKLIRYRNWDIAYRAISFEKEAYQNELNYDYLKNRKLWSFLKYL